MTDRAGIRFTRIEEDQVFDRPGGKAHWQTRCRGSSRGGRAWVRLSPVCPPASPPRRERSYPRSHSVWWRWRCDISQERNYWHERNVAQPKRNAEHVRGLRPGALQRQCSYMASKRACARASSRSPRVLQRSVRASVRASIRSCRLSSPLFRAPVTAGCAHETSNCGVPRRMARVIDLRTFLEGMELGGGGCYRADASQAEHRRD